MSSAIEALANTSLDLSLDKQRRPGSDSGCDAEAIPGTADDAAAEKVTRLLFTASQNLRIADQAIKQAQDSLDALAPAAGR